MTEVVCSGCGDQLTAYEAGQLAGDVGEALCSACVRSSEQRRREADRTRSAPTSTDGVETGLHLATLLDAIEALVCRYIVMSAAQAVAVALWVAHTHVLDAFETTPFLVVTVAGQALREDPGS